jgi:hypothetical protein
MSDFNPTFTPYEIISHFVKKVVDISFNLDYYSYIKWKNTYTLGEFQMAKIKSFDKATLRAFRTEMDALLEKYGKKTGLDFEVGNMRFSDTEVDIKVKAKVSGVKTRTDSNLELFAKMAGITNLTNRSGDRLVEYKTRSPVYPFVFERGGKRYKCSEAQARSLFAA